MVRTIRFGNRGDVRDLIRLHDGCSEQSVTRRYLAPMPILRASLATRLLCPADGFSLVSQQDGQLAGIITLAAYDARGEGLQESSSEAQARPARRADVGQLVADAYQRRGLGTTLLLRAAGEASRRGVDELVLTVLPDNPAVLGMVHAAGLRARVGTDDGLTRITLRLVPAARFRPAVRADGTRLALARVEC